MQASKPRPGRQSGAARQSRLLFFRSARASEPSEANPSFQSTFAPRETLVPQAAPHSRVCILHRENARRASVRACAQEESKPLLLLPGFLEARRKGCDWGRWSTRAERIFVAYRDSNITHPRPACARYDPPQSEDGFRARAGRQAGRSVPCPGPVSETPPAAKRRKLVFYVRRARRGPCIVRICATLEAIAEGRLLRFPGIEACYVSNREIIITWEGFANPRDYLMSLYTCITNGSMYRAVRESGVKASCFVGRLLPGLVSAAGLIS